MTDTSVSCNDNEWAESIIVILHSNRKLIIVHCRSSFMIIPEKCLCTLPDLFVCQISEEPSEEYQIKGVWRIVQFCGIQGAESDV